MTIESDQKHLFRFGVSSAQQSHTYLDGHQGLAARLGGTLHTAHCCACRADGERVHAYRSNRVDWLVKNRRLGFERVVCHLTTRSTPTPTGQHLFVRTARARYRRVSVSVKCPLRGNWCHSFQWRLLAEHRHWLSRDIQVVPRQESPWTSGLRDTLLANEVA